MTPDDAVAEYHRVIAEYDAFHRECPVEERQRQRQAERQERRQQDVRKIEDQASNQAQWEAWFRHMLITEIGRKEEDGGWFIDMMGEVVAGERKLMRKEMREKYETKIDALQTRIRQLEEHHSLEAKFFEMEHRLDARQLARHEAKRESEMIPQSELLARIDRLERQRDDLKKVADLDLLFRELAERVGELEKIGSLEARFAKLANEVKPTSETPSGELLQKIEAMQRQLDSPKGIADLDARLRELAERVGALEQTSSLEARFAELAHEVKGRSEIPQSELLEKFTALQRQVDKLKRVTDLDSRFLELTERVGELEQTNSLEARFTKFAAEVKRGSELPQSELLRIVELERRLDDFKKIATQPGPQGPPGKDGKLPIVKVFQKDTVYYAGDVVICDGSTYQALRDTGQNVNHSDWICLARAGRNGSDGRSPNSRGTYDIHEVYQQLDIVALDGAAFIAKKNAPGICPGSDWQMISRQGRQGKRGESITGPHGEKGDKGEPGPSIHSWQLDPKRYRVSPLWSDGEVGPTLELRRLFEQFMYDIGGLDGRD